MCTSSFIRAPKRPACSYIILHQEDTTARETSSLAVFFIKKSGSKIEQGEFAYSRKNYRKNIHFGFV
jgi:hypothetical protein